HLTRIEDDSGGDTLKERLAGLLHHLETLPTPAAREAHTPTPPSSEGIEPHRGVAFGPAGDSFSIGPPGLARMEPAGSIDPVWRTSPAEERAIQRTPEAPVALGETPSAL